MREILFKGKRLDNGNWTEGSLLQSEIDINQLFVNAQIHSRFADNFSIVSYDVNPKTICQWAGLRDKDDDKIFEGDIVKCWRGGKIIGYLDVIEFKNGAFWLRYRHISIYHWLENEIDSDFEVMGNIYDMIIPNHSH